MMYKTKSLKILYLTIQLDYLNYHGSFYLILPKQLNWTKGLHEAIGSIIGLWIEPGGLKLKVFSLHFYHQKSAHSSIKRVIVLWIALYNILILLMTTSISVRGIWVLLAGGFILFGHYKNGSMGWVGFEPSVRSFLSGFTSIRKCRKEISLS